MSLVSDTVCMSLSTSTHHWLVPDAHRIIHSRWIILEARKNVSDVIARGSAEMLKTVSAATSLGLGLGLLLRDRVLLNCAVVRARENPRLAITEAHRR